MSGHVSDLSGTCPSIEFTVESTRVATTASTTFGGKGCGDIAAGTYVGVAGTRREGGSLLAKYVSVSPGETPRPSSTPHPEPTPSATASPHTEPSPSASPEDGEHGEVSLRGFYEGLTGDGALALFYVSDNAHISIHILDSAAQVVRFAEGVLKHGAFSFTLTTGEAISGTVGDNSVSATLNGQSLQAPLVPTFGKEQSVAGRYFGVAHGPDGESQVMFLIDVNKNIVMIQHSGSTFSGGYGTVTVPSTSGAPFTFTLDHAVGSSSPITGIFTVNDGTFVGSFTTSAGTFTVNTFKNSLVNRIANISTRGLVGPGQGQLIGGFIITGGPKMVLIRAIGPSMVSLGVSPVVANPTLELFSRGTLLASNDDWQTNSNAAQIVASGLAPADNLESVLLIRLEPGAYTTVVRGSDQTPAIALVEVYEAGFE